MSSRFISKGRKRARAPLRPYLFLFVLSLLVGGVYLVSQRPAPEIPPYLDHAVDSIPLQGESPKLLSYVVKRGDTFRDILAGLGIPQELAYVYHKPLAAIGLAKIFPGDSVVLTSDTEGKPQELSLLSRLEYWYHLTINGLGDLTPVARRRPVDTYRYRTMVRGTLNSSLSESMAELGESDELTSRLADIFAWDINFFMDPRKGDNFTVVFEKKVVNGRAVGYGDIVGAEYINAGKKFTAIGLKDSSGRINYYDLSGKALQKQFLKAPLKFRRISSRFSHNRRHPVLGIVRPHLGIDYAAPTGTPVYAAADGLVNFAGVSGGFGKLVRITHGSAYETYYGHLHTIPSGVRTGIRVRQGDLIGTVGSTGLSTGPHLDYRMKAHGRFVNPLTISMPSGENVAARDLQRFQLAREQCAALLGMRFTGVAGSFVLDIAGPLRSVSSDSVGTPHES